MVFTIGINITKSALCSSTLKTHSNPRRRHLGSRSSADEHEPRPFRQAVHLIARITTAPSHASPTCNTATAVHKGVEATTMNRLKQAVGHTKDVASLPPRLLEKYSDFITKNAGAVGQVEGALRSLTYIIPGMLSTRYFHAISCMC